MICILFLYGCDNKHELENNLQKETTTITSTYYLTSIVHDEHLFVYAKQSGNFIHHPNCPCSQNKKSQEKVEISPFPPIIIETNPGIQLNK